MENTINVAEILKFGLNGLVFLLAMMSFTLLLNEQKKPNPNADMLCSIKDYMNKNIVLAFLTLILSIVDYNYSAVKQDNEKLSQVIKNNRPYLDGAYKQDVKLDMSGLVEKYSNQEAKDNIVSNPLVSTKSFK